MKLIFYDKKKENFDNRFKYRPPSNFLHKNVLRYEMRIDQGLAKTLSVSKTHLLVSDLLRPRIQKRLIKLWHKEYNGLKKVSFLVAYPDDFTDFKKYLYANAIMAIEPQILKTILKVWIDTKGLKKSKSRYVIESTQEILGIANRSNELILELDKKIKKIRKEVLSSI